MGKRAAISIACAVGALAVGAFFVQGRGRSPSAKTAPSATSEAELRAEIARLRSEVNSVSAAQRVDRAALQLGANGMNSAARAPEEPVNDPTAQPAPIDPKQLLADRDRTTREAVARISDHLDDLLTTETVDTRWRTETTRNVDTLFAEIPNSKVVSTDCGLRLCRVVVERTSSDELRDLAKSIANRSPFDSEVLYRYDTEAKPPRVTMYVTREGGSMAALAKAEL